MILSFFWNCLCWHTFHNGHQRSLLDIVYTNIQNFDMASSHNRLLLRFDYHKSCLSIGMCARNCFLRWPMDKHIVYNHLVFPFWHFHKIRQHIDRIWNKWQFSSILWTSDNRKFNYVTVHRPYHANNVHICYWKGHKIQHVHCMNMANIDFCPELSSQTFWHNRNRNFRTIILCIRSGICIVPPNSNRFRFHFHFLYSIWVWHEWDCFRLDLNESYHVASYSQYCVIRIKTEHGILYRRDIHSAVIYFQYSWRPLLMVYDTNYVQLIE